MLGQMAASRPKKPVQRKEPAPPGPDWSRPLTRPVNRYGFRLTTLAEALELA
jgi:hypothetical protein